MPKETRTSGYNKDSVDKAIKKDPTIKGKEAGAIHSLIKGRSAATPKSDSKPKANETRTSDYNKDSVDKAIKADPKIKGKEASAIHGLLKGRTAKTTKSDFKPKAKEKVTEGVWLIPNTVEKVIELAKLVQNPIPASNADWMLSGLIDDDDLSNFIYELERDEGPNYDVRYAVISHLQEVLPKLNTNLDSETKNAMRKYLRIRVAESKTKKLREGVLDDQDDDGFMAKRQLYDIAKYAVELHRSIQDTDNLEPWIQAKITTAAEYIDTVKHYLEYDQVRNAGDTADIMGPPDLAGIDDLELGPMPELPDLTQEDTILEYDTDEEGSSLEDWDIIDMLARRGIISAAQGRDPSQELLSAAADFALDLGTVYEIGSSDVSAWMRQFITQYKGSIVFDGERAHLYESQIKAKAIYERMTKALRK